MFGFFKRAHAEATTKMMIDDMVRLARQRWEGLPSFVWGDPYVRGYMHGLICGLLQANSEGALKGENLVIVATRVWQHATGQDPKRYLQAMAIPWAQQDPDAAAATKAGIEDAYLWLAFYVRRPDLKNEKCSRVFEAAQRQDREMLAIMGTAADTMASAASILFCANFLGRIGELVGDEAPT